MEKRATEFRIFETLAWAGSLVVAAASVVVFAFTMFHTKGDAAATKEDFTQRLDRLGSQIDRIDGKIDAVLFNQKKEK